MIYLTRFCLLEFSFVKLMRLVDQLKNYTNEQFSSLDSVKKNLILIKLVVFLKYW